MTGQQQPSGAMHISLWVAQGFLAAFLLSGTILKFMPIEKISVMMPWTGQLPSLEVRLLDVIDLLGALGLILPSLLRIRPNLTPWAAIGIIALMICAISFHLLRGEASVIGANIIAAGIGVFIAWGRFRKAPIVPK
jgi:uncharacterized membrane protein